MKKIYLKSTVLARCRLAIAALPLRPRPPSVGACLITKTDTNPFFVKMKEGADRQGEGTRR